MFSHTKQSEYHDFIVQMFQIVSIIAVRHVPAFTRNFAGIVAPYFAHENSEQMKKKSKVVGIICSSTSIL